MATACPDGSGSWVTHPRVDLLCSALCSAHTLACATCEPVASSMVQAGCLCVHGALDGLLRGTQGPAWVWFLSTSSQGQGLTNNPAHTHANPVAARRGMLSSRFRSARDIVTTSGGSPPGIGVLGAVLCGLYTRGLFVGLSPPMHACMRVYVACAGAVGASGSSAATAVSPFAALVRHLFSAAPCMFALQAKLAVVRPDPSLLYPPHPPPPSCTSWMLSLCACMSLHVCFRCVCLYVCMFVRACLCCRREWGCFRACFIARYLQFMVTWVHCLHPAPLPFHLVPAAALVPPLLGTCAPVFHWQGCRPLSAVA